MYLKNFKKNSTKLQFKIKVQKDLLQHLLCDIKTKVGIRDEKKELGENTLVYFRILLIFLIENISFVNKYIYIYIYIENIIFVALKNY